MPKMKRNEQATKLAVRIGRRLRMIRISNGLCAVAFGDIINVSHQQVFKYERGLDSISIYNLMLICDKFDIDITTIINNKYTSYDNNCDNECLALTRNFVKIKSKRKKDIIKKFVKDIYLEEIAK